MKSFSYPGCQKCLVRTCCHNVCEDYKQHVHKTQGIHIMLGELSLKDSEAALNTAFGKSCVKLKLKNKEYVIEFNTTIDRIVKEKSGV